MAQKNLLFSIYSDEELMCYICQGEVQAFDALYERYSKNLLSYFARMLNYDRELAQDALQDLFLKIAEKPERFDRSRSFKTWIYSIASNSCKNFYRHHQVKKDNWNNLHYMNQSAQYSSSPDSKIDGLEFRKMLEEILNELPPEKKEAFILKYQEEKTIAEIAEIQNCPEGSVKSRLHYTIKILEERLKIFNPVLS
jgi:RNA polymerase sigma-70 factor (ECF subfamily)